jgi:hypothetical protein
MKRHEIIFHGKMEDAQLLENQGIYARSFGM